MIMNFSTHIYSSSSSSSFHCSCSHPNHPKSVC